MENNIKRRGMKEIRAYAKQRPKVFTVYVILRLLVVAVLVRSAMLKEYESMFVCLLVLVLFMLLKGINALMSIGKKPAAPAAPTTKKCPYCLSEIPIKATRCPHCTSELDKK